MIVNDIKQYSGVRLGGFCSAWLRVLDCVLRQKALEVFLEVSNGILWLVWLLLATWMRHWMMQWTWCTYVHWGTGWCNGHDALMSIESVMPSNHLILCHPLLILPSIFPSFRVFSNEWVLCIRWPKYWSFSSSPFNEYSGLISFRIYSFDLLAVQGTLKSLLQHHSSKASILWCSAFFTVQLSHP